MRFVQPETVRLDLSDGDWIEVKKQLTWGEQQEFANCGLSPTVKGPQELQVDWAQVARRRLLIWLVDWSLVGPNGKLMPVTANSVNALDPETGDEIVEALDRHITALAEAKKATAGATSSGA